MMDDRRGIGVRLRVGAFVLSAIAVFLVLVYMLGARARLFEAKYTLYADFTEVGGLVEGAAVRLAGVQIGRVAGVRLPAEPGGKVRVELRVASQYADRIRQDSVARIETQGLLGDRLVEITVGAATQPPVKPGAVLAARESADLGRIISQGSEVAATIGALSENLNRTALALNESRVVADLAATAASARRIGEQVERGSGFAHALVYEEPATLKKLDRLLASTQAILDRTQRGESAVGVLTSQESTEAARRFVRAMDRFARAIDQKPGDGGLLPALLSDPECGFVGAKPGTCPDCARAGVYLPLVEERVAAGRGGGRRVAPPAPAAVPLGAISVEKGDRLPTGIGELDRVLGGGVVRGSLILIGGDPGIGKSTLLLQASQALAAAAPPVLYLSGEESAAQIKLRADRLGIAPDGVYLVAETDLAVIESQLDALKPRTLVVDSIQTVFLPGLESAPGSVAQVRECGARLMRLAKARGMATFLVGHVTKEGAIAGPRVLEHLVDTVLYFEGERHHSYRVLLAVKNRFGSTN